MSFGGASRTVLVLTEMPEEYLPHMQRMGLAPLFAPSVSRLLDLLHDHSISGFVLEVQKVMRSPGAERDHLLRVAGAFPLLRARRRAGRGVAFLDDADQFTNRARLFSPRKVRSHVRVPVRLNALLSGPEDSAMERPLRASLLDISRSGGFVYTLEDFAPGGAVHLRILELADPAPILAHVRWRRPWGQPDTLPGVGLLFADIRKGQLEDLTERYLGSSEGEAGRRRK